MIEIKIECDKKTYKTTDVIVVNCVIKNNSKNKPVLLWSEQPTYKTWISNAIRVDTYGWKDNLEKIKMKPNESVNKRITIEQNKNIPILDAGSYEVELDFAFSNNDQKHIESKTQLQIIGDSDGFTKTNILKRAQDFLKAESYSQKIDINGVAITDHLDRSFWTVSFSNEGPVLYGVTEVNIHKKTGNAEFPMNRLLEP